MHSPALSTPDPVSDAALLDRLVERDASALVELQRRYWGSLYAQVYGIVMDAQRADRVVAEVFEQVWYGAARMKQSRPVALVWLRDMARTLARADLAASASSVGMAPRPAVAS